MGLQARTTADPGAVSHERAADAVPGEFPVREYIGAMAMELAQMARWDGDEALGRLLDSAASLAAEPLARKPVERPQPPRPA